MYGLAILLMAASMAGERKLKAAICCDMQQLWSRLHCRSWVNSPGRDKEVSYQPLPDPRLPAEVADIAAENELGGIYGRQKISESKDKLPGTK